MCVCKATPEVQTTREEEKARWNSVAMVDVISRDLVYVGVTNWQEVVKEPGKMASCRTQPKPVTVRIVSRPCPTCKEEEVCVHACVCVLE